MKIIRLLPSLVLLLLLTTTLISAQTVSTPAELINAIAAANASPGTPSTITLATGTYNLTIDLPVLAANGLVVKGPSSGSPAILNADGLASGLIFNVSADQITIANLTLQNARSHAVAIQPGADSGRIEDCIIANPTTPLPSTAAIDGNGCQNWTVTGNSIAGVAGTTATAEPAIHFYGAATGTAVTNNLISNCDRAVGFGGDPASVIPTVNTQPADLTVNAGQTATFTVSASGTPTPTFQWYRAGVAIAGATSATYILANVTVADGGVKFTVEIANAAGSVVSREVLLTVNPYHAGTTYYLDAVNGDDTYAGSQARPWKTFKKALNSVQDRDTVLMMTGDYGTLIAGRTKDENKNWGDFALPLAHFSDWVIFKAASGQTPRATSIDFGTKNTTELTSNNLSVQLPFTVKGNVDLYIRIEGITVEDGVDLKGGRYIQIVNCKIGRLGDLSGSVANLDNKVGVGISNGRYITLRGNDITGVSIGVGAASHDLAIIGNEIHHNSHDGIRVFGGDTWLIEGNRIHDLDDGVDDADGVSWNRHSDGIHIWTLIDATYNLTVRGNVFYHIESMGIMINASTIEGKEYANWVFENNVFGPVGGTLFHGGASIKDRFVFRHNTVVYAPNDTWTSIYPNNLATGAARTMAGQVYNLSWPSCDGEGSIYNNIFADGSQAEVYTTSSLAFSGHNLYRVSPSTGNALSRGDAVLTSLPYDEVSGNVQDFMNSSGKTIGTLTAQNQAIDAGTRIAVDYVTELPERLTTDVLGLTRDARADIGAFELQGRTPSPEVYNFMDEPSAPLHFVDNFSDARLDLKDPFLNTADTTGILWHMPTGYEKFRTMGTTELVLSTIYDLNHGIVVTSKRFANVTFAFDAIWTWPDCGVVMLYQDLDNYYYFNFSGKLVRREAGVETVVATTAVGASGRGAISISFQGTTVTIAMTLGGVSQWTYSGTSPFTNGAVGFYRNRTTGNGWDRTSYDNVKIDLVSTGDLIGDLIY